MDDQLVLKNRLKVARAEKNLSQGDLAKLVGVSRQTISSIETGQFNPTAKLALVLCIALDKKTWEGPSWSFPRFLLKTQRQSEAKRRNTVSHKVLCQAFFQESDQ